IVIGCRPGAGLLADLGGIPAGGKYRAGRDPGGGRGGYRAPLERGRVAADDRRDGSTAGGVALEYVGLERRSQRRADPLGRLSGVLWNRPPGLVGPRLRLGARAARSGGDRSVSAGEPQLG